MARRSSPTASPATSNGMIETTNAASSHALRRSLRDDNVALRARPTAVSAGSTANGATLSPWSFSAVSSGSSRHGLSSPHHVPASLSSSQPPGEHTSAVETHATAIGPPRPKRKRAKTERRREQCRQNQARYRDKQRVAAIELERSVEELRLQVARLHVQRRSLLEAVNTRESNVRVMLEYFRLFRYGLTVETAATASRRLTPLDQQLAYITSAFHEDVCVDDMPGREFFLEQTRRFPTLYDGLAGILDRYEVLPVTESTMTINLTMHMDMTVTMLTIRYVFPHLLRIEHNDIRWKLLGSRLRCPVTGIFQFKGAGKVTAVRWTMDLVAGLQAVLRLDEIAVVLQQAQIAKESILLEAGNEPAHVELQREPWSDGEDLGRWNTGPRQDHQTLARDREHRARDVYEDATSNYGEGLGELIHDGKGDDFFML